jgi:cytochrome c biogenesis protein ResB
VVVEPAPAAMQGLGQQFVLEPLAEVSGVGGQMYNLPGAQVTLTQNGQTVGVYQLSSVTTFVGEAYRTIPQNVFVDGNVLQIDLRFERHYKPYTIKLLDFHHDVYPGTQIPQNYASDIVLTDPENGTNREIKISMNQPLRYAGETFFQSSFIEGDIGTVLQVVKNPGWTIPYIACTLGGAGLCIHFTLSLGKFLRRKRI